MLFLLSYLFFYFAAAISLNVPRLYEAAESGLGGVKRSRKAGVIRTYKGQRGQKEAESHEGT
jgi:hypothetical protein